MGNGRLLMRRRALPRLLVLIVSLPSLGKLGWMLCSWLLNPESVPISNVVSYGTRRIADRIGLQNRDFS